MHQARDNVHYEDNASCNDKLRRIAVSSDDDDGVVCAFWLGWLDVSDLLLFVVRAHLKDADYLLIVSFLFSKAPFVFQANATHHHGRAIN